MTAYQVQFRGLHSRRVGPTPTPSRPANSASNRKRYKKINTNRVSLNLPQWLHKTSRLIMNVWHTKFYSFLLYLVMETCGKMFCFGKWLLWGRLVWTYEISHQIANLRYLSNLRYISQKIEHRFCWMKIRKNLDNWTSLKFPPLQKATF